jgi:hypothetical protein
MNNTPIIQSTGDLDMDTVVIHHSLKDAVIFGIAVIAIIMGFIAVFWYLSHDASETIPIPFYVGFTVISLIVLHAAKGLIDDAGKVALTIGREGVKFDRYHLIEWHDIEDVYLREEDEGGDTLWLSVKEGVAFLPNGPRPVLLLAKISGLHRHINITVYGSFSLKDEDIRLLLENGLAQYRKS